MIKNSGTEPIGFYVQPVAHDDGGCMRTSAQAQTHLTDRIIVR